MKKVVLINQSSGYLTVDITNAYASKYEEVVLLTGKESFERNLNPIVKLGKIVKYNRISTFTRVLTWVCAFVQILFLLAFKYRNYEVVYVTNPPISYLVSLILKNPFSVIVFDTYPDALRNVGIKEGHWLYNLWSKWNRTLFKKAKSVYTLSEGMANQIANYMEREHINVVPLWPLFDSFTPIDKMENPFLKKYGLENKFVVMYSGNMGYTHNVETLVEVADILRNDERIHFLFIGDGKKKRELVKMSEEKHLKNCLFLDFQSVDVLPYSLAAADLGVVTLNVETALTSVPSKTFNLLAVGAPLLCIAPENAEIASIVSKYGNGKVFPNDEQVNMANFILSLLDDEKLHKKMSYASLQAAKNYTKKNAYMYLSEG